ncbi:MAG: hypothetical protein QW727_02720 [Candidatus Pacearchaeota archaeon]
MNKTIKNAAIAGILSIIVDIPLVILEVLKSLKMLSGGLLTIYIIVYVLSLLLYIVFAWGFKIIGEKTQNNLLSVMTYVFIISSIIYDGYFILAAISPSLDNPIISILTLIFYGAVGIPFGISLLKLKNQFGSIATATGILVIITSASFLTVILSIIGVLTLIPAYILEVILLFRASEKL